MNNRSKSHENILRKDIFTFQPAVRRAKIMLKDNWPLVERLYDAKHHEKKMQYISKMEQELIAKSCNSPLNSKKSSDGSVYEKLYTDTEN